MYGERGPWPDDTFDGCYVSYGDSDLKDWQYLYYKDNYPRLQSEAAVGSAQRLPPWAVD